MDLFFDTETTGFPSPKKPLDSLDQPHVIQLGYVLADEERVYAEGSCLVNPTYCPTVAWGVHPKAEEVHGISKEMVIEAGLPSDLVLTHFLHLARLADQLVCHNVNFDKTLLRILIARHAEEDIFAYTPTYCTMDNGTPLCKLPGRYPNSYKWPKLTELHEFLFGESFEGAHDALVDVRATMRCYYKMREPTEA